MDSHSRTPLSSASQNVYVPVRSGDVRVRGFTSKRFRVFRVSVVRELNVAQYASSHILYSFRPLPVKLFSQCRDSFIESFFYFQFFTGLLLWRNGATNKKCDGYAWTSFAQIPFGPITCGLKVSVYGTRRFVYRCGICLSVL